MAVNNQPRKIWWELLYSTHMCCASLQDWIFFWPLSSLTLHWGTFSLMFLFYSSIPYSFLCSDDLMRGKWKQPPVQPYTLPTFLLLSWIQYLILRFERVYRIIVLFALKWVAHSGRASAMSLSFSSPIFKTTEALVNCLAFQAKPASLT